MGQASSSQRGAAASDKTHPDPGPGSSTSRFIDEYDSYVIPPGPKPPVVFTHGAGSWLVDMEGRRYLDFYTGFGVTGLGVADSQLAGIIADQAKKVLQASSEFHNAEEGPLAKLLVEKTREAGCMPGVAAASFVNSGTEAVDRALKYARRWGMAHDPSGGKTEVVYFTHGFHGCSLGAGSATPYVIRRNYGPLLPGFTEVHYDSADALDAITERTCGVIVEPIQGVGGVSVASSEFLVALGERCRANKAVVIHDEVQSGLSRTGHLWAHGAAPQSAHPDMLVFAKAIGNGVPMGGVLVTSAVLATLDGEVRSSLGGNPMACRVGRHLVERLAEPALLAGVRKKSDIFFGRLRAMQEKYPGKITAIKGRGLFIGIELAKDPMPLVKEARQRGLLCTPSDLNTIRFLPALNMDEKDVHAGLDMFEDAVAAVTL